MRCTSFSQVLIALSFVGLAAQAQTTEPHYLKNLDIYSRNLETVVQTDLLDLVVESSYAASAKSVLAIAVKNYLSAAKERIQYFGMTYKDAFIDNPTTSPYRKNMADDEAGMIKALDLGLEKIMEITRSVQEGKTVASMEAQLGALNKATEVLKAKGSWMGNPLMKDLDLVMPTVKSKAVVATSYLMKGVIQGKRLFQIMQEIPDSAFLRGDSPESKLVIQGWDAKKSALPHAVYIVGFSHDYALFDVLMAQRISQEIGVKEPGLLTVERSWPQYKVGHKREKNIFFVEDENLLEKMKDYAVGEVQQGGKAVVTIAPEGQVPYFYAHFPPTTKTGAFVLARKIAVALAGKVPVYFLPAYSNALHHLTSTEAQALTVTLDAPIPVPTEALGKDDAWVKEQRTIYENKANSTRGTHIADLGLGEFVKGSNLPVSRLMPEQPKGLLGWACESALSF